MKKIKLLKDIVGHYMTYKKGEILIENEPDQGFNGDGTFTICQGMGIYHEVQKTDFEIIEE